MDAINQNGDSLDTASVSFTTNNPVLNNLSSSAKSSILYSGTTLSACAFGCKLLNGNYSGPVMQIRNNASTPTSIDFYADILGNLTTSGGVTLSSWLSTNSATVAYVSTWYDQTGNSNHATQTTTTTQPVYNQTNKYIDFGTTTTGGQTNAYFTLPNGAYPFNNTNYTYVFKNGPNITRTVEGVIYSGGTSGNNQFMFSRINPNTTNSFTNAWFNNDLTSSTNSITNYDVISSKYDGNTVSIYINNTLNTSRSSYGTRNQPNTNNRIGGINGYSLFLNSPIYYLYACPVALSNTDRNILEAT
jgi:hypothetical protein